MNRQEPSALQGQRQALFHLDRALCALIDERARLFVRHPELRGDAGHLPELNDGPFPLEGMRSILEQLEAGCRAARGTRASSDAGCAR